MELLQLIIIVCILEKISEFIHIHAKWTLLG